MNYDQARQTKDGGWHWTTMNDGLVRTAAPCIEFEDMPIEEIGTRPSVVKQRCEPHATQEEAERHFYDYCLEQVKEWTTSEWHSCIVCGAPTKRYLGNRHMGSLFSPGEAFCDEHFSPEALAEAEPFSPGIRLIHS